MAFWVNQQQIHIYSMTSHTHFKITFLYYQGKVIPQWNAAVKCLLQCQYLFDTSYAEFSEQSISANWADGLLALRNVSYFLLRYCLTSPKDVSGLKCRWSYDLLNLFILQYLLRLILFISRFWDRCLFNMLHLPSIIFEDMQNVCICFKFLMLGRHQ